MSEINDYPVDDQPKSKPFDRAPDRKNLVIAALGGILAIIAAGGIAYTLNEKSENERKSKDIALENLLRGRGFNDAGIGIDVSGGGKKLRVSCNPPDPVTSEIVDGSAITFFVNQNGDATLPLTDAEGQDLGTDNMQVFPLGTKEAINEFVAGFIVDTCAVINQN